MRRRLESRLRLVWCWRPKRWSPGVDIGIGIFLYVAAVVLFFYLAHEEATGGGFSGHAAHAGDLGVEFSEEHGGILARCLSWPKQCGTLFRFRSPIQNDVSNNFLEAAMEVLSNPVYLRG